MNDLHRCHLWIVNDIILTLWDCDKRQPTVEDVKNNWRFHDMNDVSDAEISKVINDVSKFY